MENTESKIWKTRSLIYTTTSTITGKKYNALHAIDQLKSVLPEVLLRIV